MKVLPMEPMAATALIRALSRQLSRVFTTTNSQHITSLWYSMALFCNWRLSSMEAVVTKVASPQGRISSASFCRGRSCAVQNGSEHFNAAAAGQASCRGVLVRGCSLLPPRRLIPGHDRGHVVRARTQLAQMALRSLTDMHVRLCVSRQDELSREPPRSAAAAAALLTACLCYERLLLGVAQTCRTCFAKAAGAAQ
jgi:hypothetical protein